MDRVTAEMVSDGGDERGNSYSVPAHSLAYLRGLKDAHITELVPGGVRGDHYHVQRHEVLVIRHADRWTLHSDTGVATAVETTQFSGGGLVCVLVPPLCSHAVENTGAKPLVIVALSDVEYTPGNSETIARPIASKT